MCLLKQAFHIHILVKLLISHPFDAAAKTRARQALATHETVRQQLTGYRDEPVRELSWQACEQPSTIKFIEVVEALLVS